MASPDGVRYLTEDKMLRQIADCLVQLDPVRSFVHTSPVTVLTDGSSAARGTSRFGDRPLEATDGEHARFGLL